MIAPYPAGGGVDTVARLIADQLATRLGQAVTIDNKPGAGATIGATLLARSAPDGYTLMLGSIVDYAIAPHTIKSLPFDIQRDLIPVVEVGFGTVGLIVNADLPAKNLKELIAMARAKPGELSFASSGVGGLQHLNAEMFMQMAGVDILHVPYKGTAQFMQDLLSGRDNQRTVFKGYLFVGEVLLNESGMQNHPLTPMLDANLVRVLQAQTRRKVG